MKVAGLDIGSRSVELVVLDAESAEIVASTTIETTPTVKDDCARLLTEAHAERVMVTGYGRTMAELEFELPTVTEIKAYARGAAHLLPGVRTVLDIGGQDTKVIALSDAGKAVKFEMNDRCAAGAGRFLELMASALQTTIAEFGPLALTGRDGVKLSSMCAVFAESEVVGLVTRGTPREDVARAVHHAIMRRTNAMLTRVSQTRPVLFAGGAARNPMLVALLREAVGEELHIPPEPHLVGALGAALLTRE